MKNLFMVAVNLDELRKNITNISSFRLLQKFNFFESSLLETERLATYSKALRGVKLNKKEHVMQETHSTGLFDLQICHAAGMKIC